MRTALATNEELIKLQVRVAAEEYKAASDDFRFNSLLIAGGLAGSIACAVGFGLLLLTTVRRPLRRLEVHFDAITRGDVAHIIEQPATVEFQRVTALLRAMRAKLGYAIQEQAEQQRLADVDRYNALQNMAETVEREARQAVEQVALRTGAMAEDANGMAGSAERVSVNAQNVAAAAEEALANAQTVASTAEELSASIREISSQIAHSNTVTRRTVETGQNAQTTIQSLSDTVARIGEVVKLITDIASQTNLLALNATIEAARAEQAGSQAVHVRAGSGEVAKSIEALQRVLVRVVRTSTKSADRRHIPRFRVDEAGVVTAAGRTQTCIVVNLSTGGAMLSGLSGLDAGERDNLRLDRHGVAVSFEVRGILKTAVHIKFAEGDPGLRAFRDVVERLTHGRTPIDVAA